MTTDASPTLPTDFEAVWKTLDLDRLAPPGDVRATVLPSKRPALADVGLAIASLPRIVLHDGTSSPGEHLSLAPGAVLGEGGMGLVRLAYQSELGRDVAIKSVRADTNDSATRSIVWEGRVTGSLEHPGIVPVYAMGRDGDDHPVLVMKRVEGTAWASLLRDPEHAAWARLPGDRLGFHLGVLTQVCNAVHCAHSRGVIHRDIKPQNVMIGDYGEVTLIDWGLAYRPGVDQPDAETALRITGTPGYMAREMLNGTGPHITPRTDVYLLGSTLHEVLTGTTRHHGGNQYALMGSVFLSAPVEYPGEVPAELAALCNAATDGDPAKRPADASAFRVALAEYLQHRNAIALADEAAASLRELQRFPYSGVDADEVKARRIFTECRYGFRHALKEWPDNERARRGLDEALEWMVRFEIADGNAEAAEALLEELPGARPELESEVRALRARLDEKARELTRLRDLDHDRDLRVSSRGRAVTSGVVAVAALVVPMTAGVAQRHGDLPLTYATNAAVTVAAMVVGGFFTWRLRAVLLSNALGVELVGGVFVALGGVLASFGLGALAGAPLHHAMVTGLLAIAVTFAVMAVTIHRRIAAMSAAVLAGAFTAAVWPEYVFECTGLAGLLSGLGATWTMLRATRDAT